MKPEQINLIEENKGLISGLLSDRFFVKKYHEWIKGAFQTESEFFLSEIGKYSGLITDNTKRPGCMNSPINYIFARRDIPYIGKNEICHIHKLITKGSSIPGGEFKNRALRLGTRDCKKVAPQMRNLFDYISQETIAPFEKSLYAHLELLYIQPFKDCNKRTARITLNWILVKNNYSPIIFNQAEDLNDYFNAIHPHKPEYSYDKFMTNTMLRTQQQILQILK